MLAYTSWDWIHTKSIRKYRGKYLLDSSQSTPFSSPKNWR